jgi:hypothetical protein
MSLFVRGILVPGLCLAASARAEDLPAESAAKRGYHLFRPTPSELLRGMSTDRPDRTESPYTVDAGHAQVELEAVRFGRDDSDTGDSEELAAMGVNVKIGLLPQADLQVGCAGGAHHTATETDGTQLDESGIGDTFVRLKWNLWGNDGGTTAFGLMPFVVLPTGSNGIGDSAARPGLIVPFAWSLPSDFGFGAMVQVDWPQESDGAGRYAEWLTTATLGHPVAGSLGAFLEFAATTRPAREGAWAGTVDAGLTFAATPSVQLDGGAVFGVSEAADGLGLFLGLSMRR